MRKVFTKVTLLVVTILSVCMGQLIYNAPIEAHFVNQHTSKFDCPYKGKYFFDSNNDGYIDILDLGDLTTAQKKPDTFPELIPYFDRNRNGIVDDEDFLDFQFYFSNPNKYPTEMICEVVYLFDFNQDGIVDDIDLEEFGYKFSNPQLLTKNDLFWFDANEDGYIDTLDLGEFSRVYSGGENIEMCKYSMY